MLTRNHLLLPGLDFCLPSKRACSKNPLDEPRELSASGIDIVQVALETLDFGSGLVAVLIRLCSNSQLRYLLRRLITLEVIC